MSKGSSLESLIVHSTMDVRLTRVQQAAKRIGGGKILAVRGPCDFFGCHVPTGRAMFFDAKQCAEPYRLKTGKKELHPDQRRQIIQYGHAGAIAGIVAESTAMGRLFWLRWDALCDNAPSYEWDHPLMYPIGDNKHFIRWEAVVAARATSPASPATERSER